MRSRSAAIVACASLVFDGELWLCDADVAIRRRRKSGDNKFTTMTNRMNQKAGSIAACITGAAGWCISYELAGGVGGGLVCGVVPPLCCEIALRMSVSDKMFCMR